MRVKRDDRHSYAMESVIAVGVLIRSGHTHPDRRLATPTLPATDRDRNFVQMPTIWWRLGDFRLKRRAQSAPNLIPKCRTVSQEMAMLRARSISSTKRRLGGNQKHGETACV